MTTTTTTTDPLLNALRATHPTAEVIEAIVPEPDGRDWLWVSQRQPTIRQIMREVAHDYEGVSVRELKSDLRAAHIVRPRHVAMYLAKQLTNRSLPFIGRQFGNRDHTTVMHGIQRIKTLLASGDAEMLERIARLTASVQKGVDA